MATTSHSVRMSEDKKAVRLSVTQDGVAGADDLTAPDLDLLTDALLELLERGSITMGQNTHSAGR